jgi:hypothetical protein
MLINNKIFTISKHIIEITNIYRHIILIIITIVYKRIVYYSSYSNLLAYYSNLWAYYSKLLLFVVVYRYLLACYSKL